MEKQLKNQEIELTHKQEVGVIYKKLRIIDQFMHNGQSIKAALDKSLTIGAMDILTLDCIVSQPASTPISIGKIPIDEEKVWENSALNYQTEGLTYLTTTLHEYGIHPTIWTFIGDDDYDYSVSREYGRYNPQTVNKLEAQIDVIRTQIQGVFDCLDVSTHVSGWHSQEQMHPEIVAFRSSILSGLISNYEGYTLPPKLQKRLNAFIQWRSALIPEIEVTESIKELIITQALQEMASFVTQGYVAPLIMRGKQEGTPIIFANTFPDLGTQFLDDICIHPEDFLGLDKISSYGSVHLPGPERFAKFMQQIPSIGPSIHFTCGFSYTTEDNPHYKNHK